jgi:hypothetical protein
MIDLLRWYDVSLHLVFPFGFVAFNTSLHSNYILHSYRCRKKASQVFAAMTIVSPKTRKIFFSDIFVNVKILNNRPFLVYAR